MELSKTKASGLWVVLIVLAIATTTWIAWAMDGNVQPNVDISMAKDLSQLSGLPQETVVKLYDSTGKWDAVRDNIFMYKRILSLIKPGTVDYGIAFDAIGKYPVTQVLTVYEFLSRNGHNFGQAQAILDKHSRGTSLEKLLAEAFDNKSYKIYLPADEAQIREWLNQGLSPQDIINADSIAQAKDKKITEIIKKKTKSTTWDQVGETFGYKFEAAENQTITLNVKGAGETTTVSGQDYESVVRNYNAKAATAEADSEKKAIQDLGLTSEQIKKYKDLGFNIHEIQNAVRLAQKSKVSIDKILQDRSDGKSWGTIISTYNG